jgi:hypothetical protein
LERSWTISPQNKWGKISLKGVVDTDGIDHFSPQKMGGESLHTLVVKFCTTKWMVETCKTQNHHKWIV